MTANDRAMTLEIVVSEPWDFFDENGGDVVFPCTIVQRRGKHLMVELQRTAKMHRREWALAVVSPRFSGQHLSGNSSGPESANIHFVNSLPDDFDKWMRGVRSAFDMPWAIGSLRSTTG